MLSSTFTLATKSTSQFSNPVDERPEFSPQRILVILTDASHLSRPEIIKVFTDLPTIWNCNVIVNYTSKGRREEGETRHIQKKHTKGKQKSIKRSKK